MLDTKRASGVALTGDTLQAALKMRTDTSGAGYAIYWANVNGILVVAGDYVTDGHKAELRQMGRKRCAHHAQPMSRCGVAAETSSLCNARHTQMPCALTSAPPPFSPPPSTPTAHPPLPHPKAPSPSARFPSQPKYALARWHASHAVACDGGWWCSSYAQQSETYALPTTGDGPVATVLKTQKPIFIKDVQKSTMLRKDLAKTYGIAQVAFAPFEGGVLEYGTSTGRATADWRELPECPTMPKATMRKAFENLGASYCLFW